MTNNSATHERREAERGGLVGKESKQFLSRGEWGRQEKRSDSLHMNIRQLRNTVRVSKEGKRVAENIK